MVIPVTTLPDLKQYTLSLLTTEAEGIPLFMQVGSGNELDQKALLIRFNRPYVSTKSGACHFCDE